MPVRRALGLAAALLSVLLLVAAALVAVLTWVSVDLDITSHKARVLQELSARTGLRLEVAGALGLRLGPELGLTATGLTLGVPGANPLLKAENAHLTAAPLPLLQGRLEPKTLELDGARLDLIRDPKGRAHWDLPARTRDLGEPAILLDDLRLRVRSSRVAYRDQAAGTSLDIRVRALETRRAGESMSLALDAVVADTPVRLSGKTVRLGRILAGQGAIPIDLRGQFLGLDIRADGALARPGTKDQAGDQTRATLTLKAKDLAGLRPWLGPDLAALGPLDARLVLDGGGGRYALAPLAVNLGQTRADGRMTLDLRGPRPVLDLDLTLAGLDLRPYLAGNEGGAAPGRAFSPDPLDLAWMDAADANLGLRIEHLRGAPLPVADLHFTGTLAGRRFHLTGAGKAQDGRALTLDLTLDATGSEPRLDLDLRAERLSIAPLLAGTGAAGLIRGDLNARAKIRTAGASEAAMAAALTGDLLLLVADAQAPLRDLDRLAGGARAILGQIVTPRSSLARIDCGMVALDFDAGRTAIKGVIDTPNSTVTSEGSLDLARETLDLRLVPNPKGVNLSVTAPVRVSGPLANPDYRIEPGGLLVSLSDLAARIAVPELLLIDAFGQAAAGSPCGKILEGSIPAEAGPLREAAGAVLQGPEALVKGVGGAVKDAGGLVKDAGEAVLEGAGGLVRGVGGLLKGAGEAVKGAVRPATPPTP